MLFAWAVTVGPFGKGIPIGRKLDWEGAQMDTVAFYGLTIGFFCDSIRLFGGVASIASVCTHLQPAFALYYLTNYHFTVNLGRK